MTSVLVFNAKLITGIHLALNDNHSLIITGIYTLKYNIKLGRTVLDT